MTLDYTPSLASPSVGITTIGWVDQCRLLSLLSARTAQ